MQSDQNGAGGIRLTEKVEWAPNEYYTRDGIETQRYLCLTFLVAQASLLLNCG